MDRRDDREPPIEANEDNAELREDDIGIRDQRWTAEEEAEGEDTGTDPDQPSAPARAAGPDEQADHLTRQDPCPEVSPGLVAPRTHRPPPR